ncbi:MAG: phosphoribosylanthranilate isomerase [Daejeonella sp.]
MKIKVCGMREALNLRSLAQLEPDYVGLIFYAKSNRFVANNNLTGVLHQLKKECKLTGVFVDENQKNILQKIKEFELKAVQLHGNENPEFCNSLKAESPQTEIIKAFGVDEKFDFQSTGDYLDCVDYFLFDTKTSDHGGSGLTFNWNILEKFPFDKPYFLSGGISPDNIDEVLKIRDKRLYAVDLNSRFEISPGLKDIEKLRLTFKKIRSQTGQEAI